MWVPLYLNNRGAFYIKKILSNNCTIQYVVLLYHKIIFIFHI